jgi:hypothetical protein
MEYSESYVPKRVIGKEMYDDYLLQLHREIAHNLAKSLDPPNPFRGTIEEGNVKILLNDTNDLHWALTYCEKKIHAEEYKYIIMGDPNTIGYSMSILERMESELSIPGTFIKTKEWIIFLLNTNEFDKLIIEKNEIVIK